MATMVIAKTTPTATLTRPHPNHLPPSPSPHPIKPSPLQVPPITPSTTGAAPLPLNPANTIATAPPARLAAAASEAGLNLTSLVPSKRLLQLSTAAEVRRYKRMTTTVPSTLGEAVPMFLYSPGIVIGVAAASVAAVIRVLQWDFTAVDAAIMFATAAWWLLQEWLLHSQLLHSPFEWWGTQAHDAHHDLPYLHVSIDGPKVVLPTLIISAIVFRLLIPDTHHFLTALATYYTMGLLYEWTHFLVHTRVPMRSLVGRIIRRAHVKHHVRSRNHWFSFMFPPLDNLMGTTPDIHIIG